jgi:hypothetical protein
VRTGCNPGFDLPATFADTCEIQPLPRRVLVQGAGPSARYAHTLSLVANRFLVAMGGNDGKSTLGDAWALDTSEKPYQWRKITDAGEMPSPRWAHMVPHQNRL